MGRPRIHASGADKQRAYRQRIKQRDAQRRKGLPFVEDRTARRLLPPIPAAYSMYHSCLHERMSPTDALAYVLDQQWGNR